MIRLPEGIAIERSERDGTIRVRVRVLTEGMQEQSTGHLPRYASIEIIRDHMERDVLTKVAAELDRLRVAILEAVRDP